MKGIYKVTFWDSAVIFVLALNIERAYQKSNKWACYCNKNGELRNGYYIKSIEYYSDLDIE